MVPRRPPAGSWREGAEWLAAVVWLATGCGGSRTGFIAADGGSDQPSLVDQSGDRPAERWDAADAGGVDAGDLRPVEPPDAGEVGSDGNDGRADSPREGEAGDGAGRDGSHDDDAEEVTREAGAADGGDAPAEGLVCPPGTADCNGNPADGCETVIASDPLSCGRCGNACPVPANADATCVAGTCGIQCRIGAGDCNGYPDDGCETAIDRDPDACGACGTVCPTAPNADAVCTHRMCGTTCKVGFADCNGVSGDGCETATDSDPDNCGACGTACPSGAHGTPRCWGGTCGLACSTGYLDCDGDPADGCEVDGTSDPLNCGSCRNDCKGQTCVAGACACAGSTETAQRIPLDMYIMLDKSGSMYGTPWNSVETAIATFINDPRSAGMGVALQYFPIGCSVAQYATPAVPMGTLPGNASAIVASLNATYPYGGTPTLPAEQGALQYAAAWKSSHPTHTVIVVLATDGYPNLCYSTVDAVSSAAASGCAGSPSIKTYVIGVGTALTNLNQIAAAGCTGSAYFVNGGSSSAFLNAMLAIQLQALGCEYLVPKPTSGVPDWNKVNVKYTPGGGGSAQILKRVSDKTACDPTSGGWYYDDNTTPTKVILCDATCNVVKGDIGGKVEIVLGCTSID